MTHMDCEFDVNDVKRIIKNRVRNETVTKSEIYDFIDDLYCDDMISREDYYYLRNFVRSLNCSY